MDMDPFHHLGLGQTDFHRVRGNKVPDIGLVLRTRLGVIKKFLEPLYVLLVTGVETVGKALSNGTHV
jgi:hypothetical protein